MTLICVVRVVVLISNLYCYLIVCSLTMLKDSVPCMGMIFYAVMIRQKSVVTLHVACSTLMDITV